MNNDDLLTNTEYSNNTTSELQDISQTNEVMANPVQIAAHGNTNISNFKKLSLTLLTITLIVLATIIGFIIVRKPNNISRQSTIPENSSNEIVKMKKECEPNFSKAILPKNGDIEPLFLRESARISGAGYEAIMRRQVRDDKTIYDIVTNSLPKEKSPYNVFVLEVDATNGAVCSQHKLGELNQLPNTGSWALSGISINASSVNDGEVFVVTENNFGSQKSDIFTDLDNNSIILLGTYMTNHQ